MKHIDLVRHLTAHGCVLLRDRGKHSVYVNPANNQTSAVPQHREINDFLARKICQTSEFRRHEEQETSPMRRRAFRRWCVGLTIICLLINLPEGAGLAGFWCIAGKPFAYAWGFGQFEHFSLGALVADLLIGVVLVVGFAQLCARSYPEATA